MRTAGMSCPDIGALEQFLRDELADEDARLVDTHVNSCTVCQSLMGELMGDRSEFLASNAIAMLADALKEEPPPQLGGFETIEHIASGGMGVVWRVRDLQLERQLAIKVMKRAHSQQPALVQRFFQEAQLCAQLAHPFIVPIHAVDRLPDGRPYYTMKLVEGETLAARLARRSSAAETRMELVSIFGRICDAMAFAHRRGVIHRDLKPQNIMLGEHGEVQLMDWGLAKFIGTARQASGETVRAEVDETLSDAAGWEDAATALAAAEIDFATRAGCVLGTLAYMPPEQAQGRVDEIDRRSDVFGLGAILCEILTGRSPYRTSSPAGDQELSRDARLQEALNELERSGLDPELVQLTLRCLAVEKDARPADAGEVTAAVANYLSSVQERLQQERVQRERQHVKAVEERRRHRLWMGLAAALLAAAGTAAAAGLYWQGNQLERRQELDLARSSLDAAQRQISHEEFAQAEESLSRAGTLLGENAPQSLHATHVRLLANAEMVRELTRIETDRTTWTKEGRFDNPKALREYEALFAQAKLDVALADLTALARSIRGSLIKKSILEGLDNWALVCAYEMHFGSGENIAELRVRRDRLLELARKVDPDPLRDQVRTPEVWADQQELEALAKKAQQEKLPPRVAALLAELLRLQGLKNGNLEPLLRTYQGHYQNDFWLNLDFAKLLQLKGKWHEALMFYQAALAVKPHNLIVLNNMAIISYEQGNVAGALEQLKLAEHSPPDNVVVRTNLGTAWLANGNPEKAIEHYRRALAINPHDAPAHYLLGKLLQRRGETALAVEHYERARQSVPHYPRLGLLDRRIEIPKERGELAAIIDEALSNADVLPVVRRTGDSAGLGAK